MLCDNNVVKITDVAMGISLFNSDYSEVRGRSCAPIRWQPWETLLLVSNVARNVIWYASLINHYASSTISHTQNYIRFYFHILGVTGVTLPSVKEAERTKESRAETKLVAGNSSGE